MVAGARSFGAVKALEDPLSLGLSDPGPVIGDHESRPTRLDGQAQIDGAAGVAKGVVEKDPHELAQRVLVPVDRRGDRVKAEPRLWMVRRRLAADLVDERLQIDVRELQAQSGV